MAPRAAFAIGGEQVAAGQRRTIDLPVSTLSDHTPVTMPVHVVHGRRDGPVLFVSAAIHGDEVIGVEIARRLLCSPRLGTLRGTLLVVPIVNAFGFLNHSRYLPDRRDLNRCFPGSQGGSLAARLADLFMTQIVTRADFGIDLHSAAIHRTNLPQIRVSPARPRTLALAEAFGAPLVIVAKLRDGSLRGAAEAAGVDMLLYEAGEALRFDELSARTGVAGVLRVMQAMGMIGARGVPRPEHPPLRASATGWVRAPAGGLLRSFRASGAVVAEKEMLGAICDPLGNSEVPVLANRRGIVIGRSNMPVVNEGDALFHIATPEDTSQREAEAAMVAQMSVEPLYDEDEII